MSTKLNRIKTFLSNLKTLHHRLMMGYLRKRGWVVFYLEEKHRECKNGTCWLKLYQSQENTNE